jgi:hypothetical protein
LECEQRLVGGAAVRERGERPALGSPSADRGEQPYPGLLRKVLAIAPPRQSELPHDALDERLVAAHELLLRAEVTTSRGLEQALRVVGAAGSLLRIGHAGACWERR